MTPTVPDQPQHMRALDIAGGGVGMARTSSAPAFAQAALRDLGVDPFTYRRARKEALRDA